MSATGAASPSAPSTLRRENGHALHALAHAMFEDGSTADAEASDRELAADL